MAEHPVRSSENVQFLSHEEIDEFLDDLDHDGDGYVDYTEVERKLDQAHEELAPDPAAHHVIARSSPLLSRKGGEPKKETADDKVRHEFLRNMMGGADRHTKIPRDDFKKLVESWKIPSLKQAKQTEEEERRYFKRLLSWRKVRAYWAVHGPEIGFIALVVSMQLAFGIWQLVKYQTQGSYRATLGWGVVMAKTCAGALYPTFFFLILSMSRYLSTFLRRSYLLSRFFNWDLSQEFHIRISCVAILLATLHAIGHLSGTIPALSDNDNEERVRALLGDHWVPLRYVDVVRTLPGITGIVALGLFYVLSLLSIPQVRRWNYEVFQLGHLLMFPIIGLMMAHGTAAVFQWPMFGYFLAFPTLMVLIERSIRVCLGFHRIPATLRVLDADTVEIATTIPSERLWKYRAGQYIFLQVPALSFFQWHPFTVSFCRGDRMMVHIKTDGNWTSRLRQLGGDSGEAQIDVGINGPFGAPAQRFYDFQHSMIIGAGIGVTPFSGILADLQHKDDEDHGGPSHARPVAEKGDEDAQQTETENVTTTTSATSTATPSSDTNNPNPGSLDFVNANVLDETRKPQPEDARTFAPDYRRVDFHWMVRDRNYLLWLSDLLNEVSRSQEWHREHTTATTPAHLDIRMTTHVTAKRKSITTHVYRWLLEMHRTEAHPASPLTGLLNPTHFGRPDFDVILDEHYEEMLAFQKSKRQGVLERRLRSEAEDGQDRTVSGVGSRRLSTWSSRRRTSSVSSRFGSAEEEGVRVGVFYCGAPVVGEILADKCRELTRRGREDGSKIEYHFMIEVFG